MSNGKLDDESVNPADSVDTWIREKALDSAVASRNPNTNADEIVAAAQVFEKYLTGNNDAGLRARMESLATEWEAMEPTCSHERCGHVFCEFATLLRAELTRDIPPEVTY